MATKNSLPLPRGWAKARAQMDRVLLWSPGIVIILVAAGILAPADGAMGNVKAILWILAILSAALISLAASRCITGFQVGVPQAYQILLKEKAGSAIIIPVTRWHRYSRLVVAVFVVVLLLGVSVFGEVVPNSGAGSAIWNIVVFAGPFLAGAYVIWTLAHFIMRKRRDLGIGLSPEGIYHWTWHACCFYRWDWLTEVVPLRSLGIHLFIKPAGVWEDVRTDPEESWISEYDAVRKNLRTIPSYLLQGDPVIAYYALCFYLRHPELREELGDERGVERIQQCDFPDVIEETKEAGRVWWFGKA